VCVCAL